MSERPILFSGAMVRALLDGTKTQTRGRRRAGGDAMTPDAHGYVRCHRCRVWRPLPATTEHAERYADDEVTLRRCADAAVCTRLADVGTGTLDADAGYVCTCDRPEVELAAERDAVTPTEIAVLSDLLRSTKLPEVVVRRMLFAVSPKRLGEHACALCGVGLEVRPVVRQVRRPTTQTDGVSGVTYEKRVHMKPHQVVVELRREGSFDLVEGQSLPRDRLGRGDLAWRFCAGCAGSLIETE